ncbi:N-formylglutamate amidohydrolase [Loktanella sp. S4079]|uniref:N-formylglutamate amidohydrolase n=1 Tax=Loktanella sp. S4079 TaxID=579483 RepID=UPI0005FA88E2|nr:N-formylglutamate amidohydrolase [Loktanella sp. S4079]KJZ21108.1 N-formylglutamate amidohydrolase [Loktanella sp. S4079]
MQETTFDLSRPAARSTSVIFASPHSGRDYTSSFIGAAELDAMEIRSSEDAYIDLLYAAAPEYGAPFIKALAPRAFVDLNRGPDELDPALIEGVQRKPHNPRIASGLGVIPRVVANGRHIYRGKISLTEAHDRIATYWRPYHDQLQALIDESNRAYGESILIDCHSMPHEALTATRLQNARRPDIVLGDRFGSTASARVLDAVDAAFTQAGLRVARNAPFAGAYIVQQYGRPSKQQHAIQVEMDRALYMDERTLEPRADFDTFKQQITAAIASIAAIGAIDGQQVAAE